MIASDGGSRVRGGHPAVGDAQPQHGAFADGAFATAEDDLVDAGKTMAREPSQRAAIRRDD